MSLFLKDLFPVKMTGRQRLNEKEEGDYDDDDDNDGDHDYYYY